MYEIDKSARCYKRFTNKSVINSDVSRQLNPLKTD